MFFRNILFNVGRKELFKSFHCRCVRINKERTAFLDIACHIVTCNVRRVRALYKIGRVDKILGLNGRIAETEVGNGYSA